MPMDATVSGAEAAASAQAEMVNETADRLVIDVVSAVDDGCMAVSESQRLIVWLRVEFIPSVSPRFERTPEDLLELQEVLDALQGSSGRTAADLAVRARSLVFRLL